MAKKTAGVHPALQKPMGNPKPIKLTESERKAAQRELALLLTAAPS